MNEPSHSDEELLALLQPHSMPEEFDFESAAPMKDTSDDEEGDQPLPGPAPPAPMAPMMVAPAAPMAPMDMAGSTAQTRPNIPSSDPFIDDTNGFESSQLDPAAKGHKEEDEDEIAYEPIKTPSRTPRSSKARTNTTRPSSRRKPGSSRPRSKPRDKAKLDLEEPERMAESTPKIEQKTEPVPEPELEQEPEPPRPPSLEFEIVINLISPQAKQEYKPIPPGDYIYRVLERIPTGVPGETWLSVEFEDGHIDQVSVYLWLPLCGE